ncbi:hypothetical protein H7Y21_00195 [Arenimonas sp.]|nr:hypothetical protein [Candidatus Parcubacteria bacterium]
MKTNQKGSITTIVLVVILVVVAIGGYVYMQKNKVSTGQPVSAEFLQSIDEDTGFGFDE